jgi:hypothetical protein
MTHEDAGHYAKKRSGVQLNETIAAKLKEKIAENSVTCAQAHTIAGELKVSPADVGAAIDLLEVRIVKCQLGLFGMGKEKSIPALSGKIDPGVEPVIDSSLVSGRLPCSIAWETAKKFNISRPMIAAVCEKMKVKVSPCQLGVF